RSIRAAAFLIDVGHGARSAFAVCPSQWQISQPPRWQIREPVRHPSTQSHHSFIPHHTSGDPVVTTGWTPRAFGVAPRLDSRMRGNDDGGAFVEMRVAQRTGMTAGSATPSFAAHGAIRGMI